MTRTPLGEPWSPEPSLPAPSLPRPLRRGDLLPRLLGPLPGPRSRALFQALARWEAPGVNTLIRGEGSLAWHSARGANVVDPDGNRFLDLTAGFGVAAVGHRHPRVVAAVRRQSGILLHGLGDVHGHALRARLAERLCRRVPVPEAQAYFAVSGADAVEIALKTALLATGKPGIVAFEPSYHGLTLGALAATSRTSFRQPFAAHLHQHLHRLPFGVSPESLDALLRARTDVGALILEPLVGREGVLVPQPGWLSAVAATCKDHGALLIADEIFTGLGRTGSWFALDQEGVKADLLCCGKALAGGLPLAVTLGRRQLMAAWATDGEALHTATFVANPLACAAALEVLAILEDEGLPARAASLRQRFAPAADRLAALGGVLEVRGRGLLWGVEVRDRDLAQGWCAAALRRGLILLAGGAEGRVLQICPPLTITERQLAAAFSLLRECFPGA